ncbi:unnamed protein product [Trichobilharzia regenti]|nr:unnamed protein product [Trichobilharzia regenti]
MMLVDMHSTSLSSPIHALTTTTESYNPSKSSPKSGFSPEVTTPLRGVVSSSGTTPSQSSPLLSALLLPGFNNNNNNSQETLLSRTSSLNQTNFIKTEPEMMNPSIGISTTSLTVVATGYNENLSNDNREGNGDSVEDADTGDGKSPVNNNNNNADNQTPHSSPVYANTSVIATTTTTPTPTSPVSSVIGATTGNMNDELQSLIPVTTAMSLATITSTDTNGELDNQLMDIDNDLESSKSDIEMMTIMR